MGIISGAFGGLGEEMSKVGSSMFKAELDKDAKKLDNDMAIQREKTIAQFRNEMELANIPLKAKATADAALTNAPTAAAAQSIITRSKAEDDVANAPLARDARLANEFSPEITAAKAGQVGAEAEARGKAETKAIVERGNDPAAVRAVRNLAQAQHIEGLGSVKQAALAQMAIDEKIKVNGLIEEFTTTTDPKRKDAIKESLTVRGIIKPGEYDTEKVTEERMNPDGTTTKTERTQKRRADGSAPPAAAKNGWDSTTGEVYKNGQVVGKAANEKEARAVYGGGAKPAEAKAPVAATAPQDKIGDAPIGALTPMRDIQESAKAGNQRAIDWLKRRDAARLENETAPTSAADALMR